ncbi:alpha/beta hydrolase [Nocardia sp. NPDC002869]|uniref:alpha/beta hydrolase n=1 Tax=Nocardia sp. NPDC002869 TaxID=3161032 RepID=UPI00398D646B
MPHPRRPRRPGRALLVTAAVAALLPMTPGPGTAAPPDPDRSGAVAPAAGIVDSVPRGGRAVELAVYSAAMNRVVPVRVLPPADPAAPAPTLYLLNGITGGADGGNWFERTDLTEFFRDEQVTVVNPLGGAGSYFTDWWADYPALGRQRWTTFLTRELPPLIDGRFRGTGAAALAGISMGAASVLQLALAAPGHFRGAGFLQWLCPDQRSPGPRHRRAGGPRRRWRPTQYVGPATGPPLGRQ